MSIYAASTDLKRGGQKGERERQEKTQERIVQITEETKQKKRRRRQNKEKERRLFFDTKKPSLEREREKEKREQKHKRKQRVRSAGIVSSFFSLLYSNLAPLGCSIPKLVSSFALYIWFLSEQKVPCLPVVFSLILSRIVVDVKAACSFSCSIAARDCEFLKVFIVPFLRLLECHLATECCIGNVVAYRRVFTQRRK